ncbi:MAG: lactate permease [Candidatus Paceibacteria bacterium]|jgi:lactate permease
MNTLWSRKLAVPRQDGHEGDIPCYVFFHSIAQAFLVGGLITLQAYVWPLISMVIH